ncbi:MAG: ParB/RepB/Spo0J family partition protein [Colwellia sp.]
MSSAKRRGLGRGLDALLATPIKANNNSDSEQASEAINQPSDSALQNISVEKLSSGKYQPRKDMSDLALEELSLSIKSQGIIQPIVVRNIGEDKYEIIAGERRWRAAKLAKLEEVPCIIKNVPDEAAVAIALIENIQREDLNAMEEAIALERLLTEFELTHQEVSIAVGKSRTTVTNLLRLNKLNSEVKTFLENGDIEMGHARALLALDGELQTSTAKIVATKELTVRETESLIKKVQNPESNKEEKSKDKSIIAFEENVAQKLGGNVAIGHNKKGKGKLVISYANMAEFEDIMAKINAIS